MIYYKVKKEENQIYLIEDKLDKRYTSKTETVFTQCNGYLGVRASYETKMLQESRGMFVTGLYHKAGAHEVSELVNCPDIIEMDICINGEKVNLDTCSLKGFRRSLNVMTGELETIVNCDLEKTKGICIKTRRFASMKNRHLICHMIEVSSEEDIIVHITTGINGQITNSGVTHFDKVEARVFDKKYMHTENSCDDGQVFKVMTVCSSNRDASQEPIFGLKRRSIYGNYEYASKSNEAFQFFKYSFVDTGTNENIADEETIKQVLGTCEKIGYEELRREHIEAFDKLWHYAKIEIEGATLEEEAEITFAQYHLFGMTPSYTSEYSVAAKGLTGEGYKGHIFWDAEIFIMPFFTSVFPEVARNLLQFRYKGLAGARDKAREYGYEGAMYPWEVAKTGKEETPLYAAINIHTGKAGKVWSGIKEHHVTADIIYALWDYYKMTGDQKFLLDYGYEMLIETAVFWCKRATFIPDKNQYVILDVIGPDEYTEHIDNNAYTNYMAYENVKIAYETISALEQELPKIYMEFAKKYDDLEDKISEWKLFLEKIYLPKANRELVIPQDDSFLSKKLLPNIEKYRNSQVKQSVLLDYSRDEVVNMQVLKQADVVMLLNMMPHLFDEETVKKNVQYYEQRTLHDSSLSYCAHAVACAEIGDIDLAYHFFEKSLEIDLDTNYQDSIDGIHSASLGGIWNCVIRGFAGVKSHMNYVEITPNLPKKWKKLKFYLKVKGQYVRIEINKDKIILKPENDIEQKVSFKINGQVYLLEKELVL
jgi:hypothetical glycosyl hydrolase